MDVLIIIVTDHQLSNAYSLLISVFGDWALPNFVKRAMSKLTPFCLCSSAYDLISEGGGELNDIQFE